MRKALRVILVLPLLAMAAGAQVLDPAMDAPGQPFSYASAPTDEIGLRGAPAGTEITPEGYLYTGYGELMFFLGDPAVAASQRLRTLDQGELPIVEYSLADGAVRYRLTLFTAAAAGAPSGVDLIGVAARNRGAAPRTAYFSVAWRYTGDLADGGLRGLHRFRRPVAARRPGGYSQPGVDYDPHWTYGFGDGLAERSGQVVYAFPLAPPPELRLTRDVAYRQPRAVVALPDTPVLWTRYALHLAPGQSLRLAFKMPVAPISAADSVALARLRALDFDAALARTRDEWRALLARGMQISLAEPKVVATFRASLMYDLLAQEHVGGDWIQTVNLLQYHAFWLRDGANIMHAYDVAGYPRAVRRSLPFFLTMQRPDGLFISQSGQYDGWGQALWAFGQYYRCSHDLAFARGVYPAVRRAVAWLERARAADPLHLMPASDPGDDEFTHTVAHVTGFNFFALDGLRAAIVLAEATGAAADAAAWRRDYADYHRTLIARLDAVAARTGGYMPPGLDVAGGHDWGNMMALYPGPILPPFDPKVTATLAHTRAEFAEGLMTYGGLLHHYITMKDTESEVIRGQQQLALGDLYAILLHTSSTQAGFEYGVEPWAGRDYGQDLAPHGWFAAAYVSLLRNMLVREQAGDLHLLSVLSPAWSRPGDRLAVRDAPTYFGRLGYSAAFSAAGMTLTLAPHFTAPLRRIVVHLPWYVAVRSATADGAPVAPSGGALVLPPTARRISVQWEWRDPGARYSFRGAVAAFEAEYARRYRLFRRDGMPH